MLSLIAAMERRRGIGVDNGLPWYIPLDMDWFKSRTIGKTVVMGRRTYQSIGRPLPRRKNVVVTSDMDLKAPGVTLMPDFANVLHMFKTTETIVIGGATLYEQALPYVERMYLTRVDSDFFCDTFFPEFSLDGWLMKKSEMHPAGKRNSFPLRFEIYDRIFD